MCAVCLGYSACHAVDVYKKHVCTRIDYEYADMCGCMYMCVGVCCTRLRHVHLCVFLWCDCVYECVCMGAHICVYI
jgi:hypothetical protein